MAEQIFNLIAGRIVTFAGEKQGRVSRHSIGKARIQYSRGVYGSKQSLKHLSQVNLALTAVIGRNLARNVNHHAGLRFIQCDL